MSSPLSDAIQKRIADSFGLQTIMQTIGAELVSIDSGKVTIRMPFKEGLSQQNGFIHAGIITTIVDSACGFAAMTLTPGTSSVLTVEFKTNFCNPAIGDEFIAVGEVKKAGRRIMVTSGEVYGFKGGQKKLVAMMQATIMVLED